MEQFSNTAHGRLRERAFTITQEAGGDVSEAFRMWHKFRPMLAREYARPTPKAPLRAKLTKPWR